MTFDTRAGRAAQGIHRAVDVMEMSRRAKEPKKIERFYRYRGRKQRNRRVGAILVASALAVAAILVAIRALPWGAPPARRRRPRPAMRSPSTCRNRRPPPSMRSAPSELHAPGTW